MTKTLRMKFIATSMTVVSILLILLIGGINIANFSVNERMTQEFLMIVCENQGTFPERKPLEEPGRVPKDIFRIQPDGRFPAAMEYFCVRTDDSGTVIFCDVSHISSVTEEEAEVYAARIASSDSRSGREDGLRYFVEENENGGGKIIVAADTSDQLRSELQLLLLSLAAGAAGWLLMLVLVFLLSGRAVKPIAENMERQKRFVTDAGHEIKTPLAIIIANTDALELHQGETKWSRNIRSQTERLSELMQNLLTLSRMDEGAASVVMEECSFSLLTEEAAEQFREPAESRGIAFRCDIAKEIAVKADRRQLLQLISILLDNAVKYAEGDGPQINVSLTRQDKTAVLRISNTFSLEEREDPQKWFRRFYRGDSARTQKNGGCGIGLSVAAAIVRLHKGAIKAEYENGQMVFTVNLHLY